MNSGSSLKMMAPYLIFLVANAPHPRPGEGFNVIGALAGTGRLR
jgi:hypothetical protein